MGAAKDQPITTEEFWVLSHSPKYSDKRLELHEGGLIVIPAANWKHGYLVSKIARVIGNFVEANNLGVIMISTGYACFPHARRDSVHTADLSFISSEHIPTPLPETFVPFAPNLAVTVITTDNAEELNWLRVRVNNFLVAGVGSFWVVQSLHKTIAIHKPGDCVTICFEGDILRDSQILPGFQIAVADLLG